MMPDLVLSSTPVVAPYVGARALPVTNFVDYENGGIALNDPSQGLMVQVWRCRIVNGKFLLSAANTPEFEFFFAEDAREISLTFDQNMRPALAYVQANVAKLRWFDSALGAQTITELPAGALNPKLHLDDKRAMQLPNSDIILGYVLNGNLYMRQQRDRFLIEYLLAQNVDGLLKIGFNRKLRLQFHLLGDPSSAVF